MNVGTNPKPFAFELTETGESDAKLIVRIGLDGCIEYGEGVELDEASKLFWSSVSAQVEDIAWRLEVCEVALSRHVAIQQRIITTDDKGRLLWGGISERFDGLLSAVCAKGIDNEPSEVVLAIVKARSEVDA